MCIRVQRHGLMFCHTKMMSFLMSFDLIHKESFIKDSYELVIIQTRVHKIVVYFVKALRLYLTLKVICK